MFPSWNWTLIAVSASFHSVAILSTLFRLWYRWHTARMWWDDAWVSVALLADVACLIVTVLEQPIPNSDFPQFFTVGNWVFSLAYPTLMWAARISILTSIVRVSRPEGIQKRIAVGTGIFFGLIGLAILATRLQLCIAHACLMTRGTLIIQTTVDCATDVLLSAIPIWFLRGLRLDQKRKILISSTFSATMVIIVVTVIEAVMFFSQPTHLTSGSIIFEHVKLACSVIVCNLLVIVTFVYRILHKSDADRMPKTSKIEFTTVDPTHWVGSSTVTSRRRSLSSSRTTESSTGPFPGNRSKVSRSITIVTPQMDIERVDERR